jgi:hypothetical protein
MPMTCDPIMARHFRDNVSTLVGEENFRQIGHRTGSTDMGDLSQVMPILHPVHRRCEGHRPRRDFAIVDKTLAYLGKAKALGGHGGRPHVGRRRRGPRGARQGQAADDPRGLLKAQRALARRETYEG